MGLHAGPSIKDSAVVFVTGRSQAVTSASVTTALQAALKDLGTSLGLATTEARNGGATSARQTSQTVPAGVHRNIHAHPKLADGACLTPKRLH